MRPLDFTLDSREGSLAVQTETRVRFGHHILQCSLALTPAEHALGLSKHAALSEGEGLLFVFPQTKTATFWMSAVGFPIDILGLDAESRVTKIVENGRPGSVERWTFPKVAAVLEVRGGLSRRAGVRVGDLLEQEDANPNENIEDHEPHMTTVPGGHTFDTPKEEYFSSLWGDELADTAMEPRVDHPATRVGRRVAQIVDEAKFVEKVSHILLGKVEEMQWTPDPLNNNETERTVVSRAGLARWLTGQADASSLQY